MSDLMLTAVLSMPYDMAMADDWSRRQFYDRAQQALDEIERLTAERDKARAERDALADVLPGYYYMDPPDGGNVPVLEQLRRMAKDAERYRFLSCKGVPPYFHRCSRWRLEYWNGEWWDPLMKEELDAAIDAQIEKEERP